MAATNGPAPEPAPAPDPAPTPSNCVNCRHALTPGAKHCANCGCTATARPKDENHSERLTRLEEQAAALAPVRKLFDRLKARGVDADDVTDSQLDTVASIKKNGPLSLLGQFKGGMGGMFPGLFPSDPAPTDLGPEDDEVPPAPALPAPAPKRKR